MKHIVFLFVQLIYGVVIPDGSFASKQLQKYNMKPSNVYFCDDIQKDICQANIDLLIFNSTVVPTLTVESLDRLLVDISKHLEPLGLVVIDPGCDTTLYTKSLGYQYILNNPTELWNYNLVSVVIEDDKISARRGSSLIFNGRKLDRLNKIFMDFDVEE